MISKCKINLAQTLTMTLNYSLNGWLSHKVHHWAIKDFYQLFELYRQMTLWHFSFFWPLGEILHVGHCSWEVLKPPVPLCTEHFGKSSKKSVFLLSGWPPSLTVSFLWILLVCVWPKIMIICFLKQILHQKSHFHAAVKSQNSQMVV